MLALLAPLIAAGWGGVARAIWSALAELIGTRIGAALVAASLAWIAGDWHGAARIEERDARAVAVETAVRAAQAASDRRDARADEAMIIGRAAARAATYEEISNVPIPAPRPGDAGCYDGRRLR